MNEFEQLNRGATKIRFLGLSRDERTNRWKVPCPKCGKEFIPPTTMLNFDDQECPWARCAARIHIDYTAETATLRQVIA